MLPDSVPWLLTEWHNLSINVISRLFKYRIVKSQTVTALFRDNRPLAIALVVFSIMPLLFSSALGSWLLINRTLVTELIPLYGSLFILASCITMAAGLTPTTFVALVSGFFLGLESIPFLIGAYVLASAFGYGLGRLLDGGRLQHSLMQYHLAARVADDLRERPISMVILVRLSPALPFCLMNLLLAALKVRFSTYLVAGAAGMLPRTLLSLWIGSQSRDLVELLQGGGGQLETLLVIVGSVVTVGLLVWLITMRVRSYLK